MTEARYDLHGITLAVRSGDPALLEAVHGRLRHFAVAGVGGPVSAPAEVTLSYAVGEAPLTRPAGAGRPVYDPPSGEVLWFAGEDCLWIDDDRGVQVRCEPTAGRSRVLASPARAGDLWMLSRPMVTLPLLELLKRRGLFGVHAAGVASGGSGVLLAGASGAGKSTLTIALLRGGFDLLGDDMVFLRHGAGGLLAHAFADEVDVTPSSAAFFEELSARVGDGPPPGGWPKHRVRAEEVYGASVPTYARPELLLFPEIAPGADATSALEPLSDDAALLALAPNVLLTDAPAAQAHLDALGELVAQARCLRLRTGRDLDAVPDLVRCALSSSVRRRAGASA